MKRKTLQEQYNLIKEGKGHEGVFMNDAKRQFPNVVRNAAALSETINSLKKHHIITDPKVEVAKSPDFFKLFKEAALSINENQYKKGDKLHTKLKNGKEFDVIFDSYSSTEGVAYGKIDGERKSFQLDTVVDESLKEAKAIEKKTPKEVLDLEDKNYQSDGKDDFDDIYGEEFELGIYVEMSDPKNEDKSVLDIKRIVAKNIRKDSLYYVKDGQFGIKGVGYTDEAPGLKASKSDQMEKVKLDESTNPENLDKLYSDNQSWNDDIDNLQKIKNNLSTEEKKRFERLTPNDQKTFEKIMRMMDGELEESLNGDKKWSSYEQRMVNQIKAAQKEKRGMYTLPMKTQDFYRKHKDIFDESLNEAKFKKGQTVKYIVPGTSDKMESGKITDFKSTRDEDFAVIDGKTISFSHISESLKEAKKESIDKKLSEIDKNSTIAALEVKIDALDEIIESKSQRISMVTEDEDLANIVDKKKIKAMQKEIKLLEKKKAGFQKTYEKLCGKAYEAKETIDENQIEETKNDWPEVVDSRYGDYKFELEKVMSDRAKYKVIDVETGKEEIGGRVYNTPAQLQASADDLIKPAGGRQSSQF
jgi:hypothetical protein